MSNFEQSQPPSKAHMAFITVAPLLIIHLSPTHWGVATRNGELMNPKNVYGVQ